MYMAVTADQYELPIKWADSPQALAEMLGMTRQSVLSAVSRTKSNPNYGKRGGVKIIKVIDV